MKYWTMKELRFIERNKHLTDKHLAGIFSVPKTTIEGVRKRYGIMKGKEVGRFKKGNIPANKGRERTEWMTEEGQKRSQLTQFKRA